MNISELIRGIVYRGSNTILETFELSLYSPSYILTSFYCSCESTFQLVTWNALLFL